MTVLDALPPNVHDPARLAALDAYAILDTDPEKGFDDVVLLARNICDVPVALVSLVTNDRQWFKARIGFPECGTDLNSSVCAYVLAEPDLLVIPDLSRDPRTRANPLVTGGPRIRFYAGAPLRTPDGAVLGSLCVIDVEPRPGGLTLRQAESLRALAGQVMAQLELRRALADQRRLLGQGEELIRTQAAVSVAGGDLTVMLDALVTGAMEAVPHAEGAVIETLDGEELVYRATKGVLVPHAGLRVPLRGSLAGACLLSGEPLLVPDVLEDPRVKRELVTALRLRSCVLVPVRRAGEAVGVLKLQSSRRDAFTAMDLKLAQVLAGTVSAGLAEVSEAAARREAETRLRRAQEAGGVGVFSIGLDGILHATPEFCRLYGLPARDSYPSTAFEQLIIPEDAHLISTASSRRSGQAPCDVEYRIRRPDTGELRWIARKGELEHDEAGRPVRFAGVARDITEQRADRDALAESERYKTVLLELGDRLRDLTEVPEVTRVAAKVAGTALRASRAGFGQLDATGEHVSIEPDWTAPGQVSIAGLHRFADYGDFHHGLLRGEPLVIHDAGSDPRTAAFVPALQVIDLAAFVDTPLRERGSTVALFFVHDRVPRTWTAQELEFMRAVADRVEVGVARLRAEERQRLLNHELSHRMKNLFSMVQAIAVQTLRGASDVELAREVLARRLVALGKAHDILLRGTAERAPLASVVREGIGVLEEASGRVRVSGPEVEIGSTAALSLALMLHEMTTNALKYGALSVPEGQVDLTWHVSDGEGGPILGLSWRERGGPPVQPPTRRGFGTRLIERGLTGQVGGALSLDYLPEGLTCVVEAPLRNLQDGG
ncbi:GAF domain-containing protein [Methylobacterium sp. JK268]